MPTLYEMTQDWENVLEMLYDPDVPEEAVFDTIELIECEIDAKADAYAKIIKDLIASAENAKAESVRLTARARAYTNKADSLKKRLHEAMIAVGKSKIKTDIFSFNIQKNPAKLEIDDIGSVLKRAEYIKPHVVGEGDIDKAKLKEDIANGVNVDGAKLTQSESLRIR